MHCFLLLGNMLYFLWNNNNHYDHSYELSTEPCCNLANNNYCLIENQHLICLADQHWKQHYWPTVTKGYALQIQMCLYKQMFSLLSWLCKVIVTWNFYEDCISLANSGQGTLTNEVYSMLLSFFPSLLTFFEDTRLLATLLKLDFCWRK